MSNSQRGIWTWLLTAQRSFRCWAGCSAVPHRSLSVCTSVLTSCTRALITVRTQVEPTATTGSFQALRKTQVKVTVTDNVALVQCRHERPSSLTSSQLCHAKHTLTEQTVRLCCGGEVACIVCGDPLYVNEVNRRLYLLWSPGPGCGKVAL